MQGVEKLLNKSACFFCKCFEIQMFRKKCGLQQAHGTCDGISICIVYAAM